jgi:heme exporter protein B
MNSSLVKEVLAILRKEWLAEMRTKNNLLGASLFSLISVIAMAFASVGQIPTATLSAGMFSIVMLFSASLSLPRVFLLEDEQRTTDLLKLWARPVPVFLGKLLYASLLMLFTSFALICLFSIFVQVNIINPLLIILALVIESFTLAGAMSICGMLVSGASNRWITVVVVALPLLLPQIAMCIGALKVGFGEGTVAGGWQNLTGLLFFAVAILAIGPILAEFMNQRAVSVQRND